MQQAPLAFHPIALRGSLFRTRQPSPAGGAFNFLLQIADVGVEPLLLDLADEQREVALTLPGRYAISPVIRGAIKAVPGIVDIVDT